MHNLTHKKFLQEKIIAVMLLFCASFSLYAADVGDLLPGFQLKDQFGKAHTLEPAIKRIYFTHDMAGGKLLKAALGDNGQAILDGQQAVAMTDVSAMPSVIRSMMALPAALSVAPVPPCQESRCAPIITISSLGQSSSCTAA